MLVFVGCIGASYFYGHKILGEPFKGILGETIGQFVAGFVGMFVGMIFTGLIMVFMDRGKKTQDELDAEWVNANPRPKLRISDKPPIIRSTPDFIPSPQ